MPTLDETWRKSTRSNYEGSCVEVRRVGSTVQVRDTKQAEAGPVLGFAPATWLSFVASAKDGEFDR